MQLFFFLFLTLNQNLVVKANSECLFPACFCFDDSVNCRARELKSLPKSTIPNKLQYKQLSLSNNNIVKLGDDSFVGLNLTKVWFRFNNLRIISNNAFRGVIGIAMISFQSNNIKEVDAEAFEPLADSLNTLNINMNEFINVPNLSGMQVLETLNLSHNQISTLNMPDGTYEPLFPISLKALAININFLQHIEESWFEGMVNLESLNLAGNRIATIDGNSFVTLKNLILLDLSNNTIMHIANEWFFKLTKIETVILSYQRGVEISIDNFAFDPEKPRTINAEFYLEGNRIRHLENRAFCPRKFPRNSNDIVSLNKSTLNNVNPCILRQIASMKTNDVTILYNMTTYGDENNVVFNCSSVNYFARLNINAVLNFFNDTIGSIVFNYRNCARRMSYMDVCEDFTQFNCYDPSIYVNFTRSATSGASEIIRTNGILRLNATSDISIPCTIIGFNNEVVPDIEWRDTKNIKILNTEDRGLNRRIQTRHLQLKNVSRNNNGIYYCTRKEGTPKVEIEIIVQSAPSQPKIKDVQIIDRITSLNWEVNDLGDLDLSDFHLEWYGSRNTINTYSTKLTSNSNNLFIPFQIPSNATIRIALENALGRSPKSDSFFVFGTEKASATALCMLELHTVFNKCFGMKYDPE